MNKRSRRNANMIMLMRVVFPLLLLAGGVSAGDNPPIPITFSLDQPGTVTLVIEDAQGVRVRNLVSGVAFEAGVNTVYWDGTREAMGPGGHALNADELVEPGAYTVRGLVRDAVRVNYQFSAYGPGDPPWRSSARTPLGDQTGSWLADHSPAWAVAYVEHGRSGGPEVIIGAHVVEAGDGVMGVNLDGEKQWGVGRIGGHWTGATHVAPDHGPNAASTVAAYAATYWDGEVRLAVLTTDSRVRSFDPHKTGQNQVGGLAAWDRQLLVSLPYQQALWWADGESGAFKTKLETDMAFGDMVFDREGRLLVLAWERTDRGYNRIPGQLPHDPRHPERNALRRYTVELVDGAINLSEPELLVTDLQSPERIAVDADGRLYVSDWGTRHQVMVYEADGTFVRAIGTPGGPRLGPYDETRMHDPRGLTIVPTADGDAYLLWVAERDNAPRRISRWTLEGEFVDAIYGGPKYGGGGQIDPADPTRFYYEHLNHAFELRLDWEAGTSRVHGIYAHPGLIQAKGWQANLGGRHKQSPPPQQAIHYAGRQYMSNTFNAAPAGGGSVSALWIMEDGVIRPVAAVGRAEEWPVLEQPEYEHLWPRRVRRNFVIFAWSDRSGDGLPQPDEVTMKALDRWTGSVTMTEDFEMITSSFALLKPEGFTDEGVPLYDAGNATQPIPYDEALHFSGNSQILLHDDWIVHVISPVQGYRDGKLVWAYANHWPNLHAGHRAPATQHPGQLIATTRIIGYPFRPRGVEGVEPIWAINGDRGNIYLMTLDGLYVETLGADQRVAPRLNLPEAVRGMDVNAYSFVGEHFWPTLTQADDGTLYLVAGKTFSGLFTVEGLETLQPLDAGSITVTADALEQAEAYRAAREASRIERAGRATHDVPTISEPFDVDGAADKWADQAWMPIGRYSVRRETHEMEATVALSPRHLHAAFRVGLPGILRNSGEDWQVLFKTGGALDIQLGTDAQADPDRTDPVDGDLRLLVTRVAGEPLAVLYQPVVADTDRHQPAHFASPWRTLTFDRVVDVSEHVELVAGGGGLFEFSIPLDVLGWTPAAGATYRADIGVLRGQDDSTIDRQYWQNKATGLLSDVPGEARLTPSAWGEWTVKE